MNTVIKLLRKELKDWREEYKSAQKFYKGLTYNRNAKKSVKEANLNIKELKQVIKILESYKRRNINLDTVLWAGVKSIYDEP